MTATAGQQTTVRRERRIIERPRLIKLLDEAEQRTILLLAPAGYGKTTLARQWAKTLSRAIWVTLTPAHRDVVTLAEDLAEGIDALGGDAKGFIQEYLRAQTNPQRAARDVGSAISDRLNSARIQWLVLDDYHSVMDSEAAQDLIVQLRTRCAARLLVASRLRPTWADGRGVLYGENAEIGRDQLAMDLKESEQVLQSRPSSASIARQAQGWPAVLALAAAADVPAPPEGRLSLPGALHRYLAEELFLKASPRLQATLFALALLGSLPEGSLRSRLGDQFPTIAGQARALGFDSGDGSAFEIHPLIREFLLQKIHDDGDWEVKVREAIEISLDECHWANALDLVLRFKLLDLVEPVLVRAFKPLVRSGRLETLRSFADEVASSPTFPPPAVEVAQAELALRDGQLELARDLAERILSPLEATHPLFSRAAAILGHSCFLLADFEAAETAFAQASESSADERDQAEALHGLALANVFGERPGAASAVAALGSRRHRSPTDLVRYATARIALRRFIDPTGLAGQLHLETTRLALGQVEDPRARTAVTYAIAGALAQAADYKEAKEWLASFFADAETFGLGFTLPYANWTSAQIALGLRRFADAERGLQAVEDAADRSGDLHHDVNARSLRARLLLQTGDYDGAIALVAPPPPERLIPSWLGEYYATRALALACSGEASSSDEAAALAMNASRATEIRLLAQGAMAITRHEREIAPALSLFEAAGSSNIWDPIICAIRASRSFADTVAREPAIRPILERLYRRIGDQPLARRAGFRVRSKAGPSEVLSPREFEILGLIARGFTNPQISRALFIAESTTKVHVRHILEKLGVKTRAEAVARLELFS